MQGRNSHRTGRPASRPPKPWRRRLGGPVAFRVIVASWLVLTCHLDAQSPAPNWSQFRGNARLTGVAANAPPETLSLKWTFEAGDSIESSAAIIDGAVYVGSSKGELLAIDLDAGKL